MPLPLFHQNMCITAKWSKIKGCILYFVVLLCNSYLRFVHKKGFLPLASNQLVHSSTVPSRLFFVVVFSFFCNPQDSKHNPLDWGKKEKKKSAQNISQCSCLWTCQCPHIPSAGHLYWKALHVWAPRQRASFRVLARLEEPPDELQHLAGCGGNGPCSFAPSRTSPLLSPQSFLAQFWPMTVSGEHM